MRALVRREASPTQRLLNAVQLVRRRWRLRHAMVGATVVTGIAVAVLVAVALGMQQNGFSAGSIAASRVVVGVAVLAAVVWYVLVPWLRRVPDERVALYVEERVPQLDGAMVSAVEALGVDLPDNVRSSALTQGLVHSANEQLRRYGDAPSIEAGNLQRTGIWLASALMAAAALFTLGPDVLRQGARLVLTPWRDAEAAVPYAIGVEPGNAAIPRGTDQQITAQLRGFHSDLVELLVRRGSGDSWERIPMEATHAAGATADSTHFRARLFDLDQDAEYLVESNGVRSSVFRLTVKNLPAVKRLDVDLHYPAYTGLASEKVEDSGDIAAIIGTRAVVSVQTTLPIRGGRLVLEGDSARALTRGSDGVWRGEMTVKRDGFYRVELESEDGTRVAGAVDYVIDALEDNPPTVRFVKPGRDTRPTSTDEVLVEVAATDDYGVAKVELTYSVNGGPNQNVVLTESSRRSRDLSATHTFFLDELKLQPGDVVSYWATATDAGPPGGKRSSTSDIYFLTVRPFGRDYRQNQQGGGGGGGGSQDTPGTLTQAQREIVAATFKTDRDRETTPATEFRENVSTILMSETRLRERVEKLVQQMSRGVVQASDSGFRVLAELLPQAAREMTIAEKALGERQTTNALPPEQRALQVLERAEAVFRDIQVSRGGGGGGGGGGQQSNPEDLADLFELETDKLRNQYEEVQRGQDQAASQKSDELLERLKQLAARQQQENERQRQRGQQGASGSAGGGGQRELADEAEAMARQLERLARERQSEEMAESARRLQEAATAMRRSAAASGDAGRASGAAALDRMERARRLLEDGRRNAVTKSAQDAADRAEALVQRQKEVAKDVEGLPRAGATRPDKEQQLDTRKESLVDDVAKLEEDLDRISRDTRRERPDASRSLQEAANAIRDRRVADKIRFSRGLMRQGAPESVRNFEDQITNDLESVRDRIASAANGAMADSSGRRARALDKARDVVRGLASLDERMKEREQRGGSANGQSGQGQGSAERNQGGQPGQGTAGQNQPGQRGSQQGQGQSGQGQQGSSQQGQGQQGQGQQGQGQQGQGQQGQGQQGQGQQGQGGRQGQQGQGGAGQAMGQGQQGQGGGRGVAGGMPGAQMGGPGGGIRQFSPEDVRQFSRELRGRREDAEALRQALATTGRSTQDLDRLIGRLRALESERAFQDPQELAKLRGAVVDGFKEFEFSLRREFGEAGDDRPTLGGSDDVPLGYRDLVNEYFRSLARRPNRP
ncbi:MAG: DUF4175 family protein [Gemmatimonadaceae bacterium]